MEKRKRIVVKIGSNVLTKDDGKLDITRVSSIVDQVAWMKRNNYDVIVVSSGAVACGKRELEVNHQLDSVEQRQLYSAMGQVKLINLYYDLFREYNIHIGQILTMKENFEIGEQYTNQKACMEVMLENDVVPIVNENDTVCVTELMFTDNDELSGLVAQMIGAETLILLSNIDGIYTGDPSLIESKVIEKVKKEDDLTTYIQSKKSSAGRGGMETKYQTARKVAESGIRVIIANGKRDNILLNILENNGKSIYTEFVQ